jgi:hypothetical protein
VIIKADVRLTRMTQDLLSRGLNPASASPNLHEPVKKLLMLLRQESIHG